VHKSNWMINPNKGQSSSETLQRLEMKQRQIEMGTLACNDDYAEVDSYYLYSVGTSTKNHSCRCVRRKRGTALSSLVE
jgi:hypothetical protein